jgi:glycosyltransferase involved in cell wall biosynthesis
VVHDEQRAGAHAPVEEGPLISIVTPSLDQGPYLDAAIRSVLSQDADVEYVVIDGGSNDDSRDVIERHARRLAAWRSEPDGGQYDAINKGFAVTSGEIMAWLNADDFYLPGSFSAVSEIFETYPEIEWLAASVAVTANERGQLVRLKSIGRFSRESFFRGYNLPGPPAWHVGHFIPQESTFWRRALWEKAGGSVDASLRMAGDFDLWARFYQHAELWGVRAPLGVYRQQPRQKTALAYSDYVAEAEAVLRRHGGRRYLQLEGSVRSRVQRRVTSTAVWRLPTAVRAELEQRKLVYAARELVWNAGADRWVPSTEYFF